MLKHRSGLSRRAFLRLGGSAVLLPLAPALGRARPARRAAASTRSLHLAAFSQRQSELLLTMARTLFPHDFLGDEHYLQIVGALDAKAAADTSVASLLQTGLAAFPTDFTASAEAKRESYLRTVEASPFFRLVYQETLTGLYGNPTVAALLGYEGSSVEHGGYIERGFDDISWLPPEGSVSK